MSRSRTERILARPLQVESPQVPPPERRLGHRGLPGRVPEEVLVEEPLEIRLGDDLVATTMRTPGHDFELAAGFLWAEGRLSRAPTEVRYCATGSASDTGFNVVSVDPGPASVARGSLALGSAATAAPARLGLTSSSCGICGAEQVEALVERLDPLRSRETISERVLTSSGQTMLDRQELFARTGGSHAAAALDGDGDVIVVREDIGRHNAVDKVVGALLFDAALPASVPDAAPPGRARVLWVSGRASFEIVQKAWAAGFAALVAVGAVSALAVHTADRGGLVLAGFARGDRVTVYAGEDRVERVVR